MNSSQLTGQSDSHITYLDESLGIHHDLVEPWLALKEAAQQAGFNLKIASGFRSFDRQLAIWNNKFRGLRPVKDINNQLIDIDSLGSLDKLHAIMLFSALPGASRHHFGSDIDVYDPDLLNGKPLQLEPWEYQNSGPLAKLSAWLDNHQDQFGFFKPYDVYRGGVACEPWHLSFHQIAKPAQQQLSHELLADIIEHADIAGKEKILSNLPLLFKQYINNIRPLT